ncbi:MAG: hypothetical protein BWZ02_03105 [Lentisphaerae bacterium ADurb.BinA184]|nr:MAG: hypothetical protein BWZ02_03105 [Lentisphaerae bacterium ADurb.BinA184]
MEKHEIVAELAKLGLGAQDGSVLLLVPMALVAWADGQADIEEMDAIAAKHCTPGGRTGGKGGCTLRLSETARKFYYRDFVYAEPDHKMAAHLIVLLRHMLSAAPKEKADEWRVLVTQTCLEVARSSGGFLGMATISAREREVIEGLVARLGLSRTPEAHALLDEAGVA